MRQIRARYISEMYGKPSCRLHREPASKISLTPRNPEQRMQPTLANGCSNSKAPSTFTLLLIAADYNRTANWRIRCYSRRCKCVLCTLKKTGLNTGTCKVRVVPELRNNCIRKYKEILVIAASSSFLTTLLLYCMFEVPVFSYSS